MKHAHTLTMCLQSTWGVFIPSPQGYFTGSRIIKAVKEMSLTGTGKQLTQHTNTIYIVLLLQVGEFVHHSLDNEFRQDTQVFVALWKEVSGSCS